MAKTIENLFFYLVYLFDFILIVQALTLFKLPVKKKILWLLISYGLLNSACNFSQETLPDNLGYPILTFFTLAELSIFSALFYTIISNKNFRKIIVALNIAFSIIVILNYEAGKHRSIDSLPIGIETILILLYSFYYLYEQMNIVDDTFIYSRYHFWMVVGIMTYLGGSFFIYIFANQVTNDEMLFELLDNYWFLTYVFYIVKNIFFGIGLMIFSKKIQSRKPLIKQYNPYLN